MSSKPTAAVSNANAELTYDIAEYDPKTDTATFVDPDTEETFSLRSNAPQGPDLVVILRRLGYRMRMEPGA